jgi:protein-arginine kinase activator protein McsA
MNTQAGKRPREKILKPGLCDSCSSTMSAVWRKNKTQCNSCYGKSYKEAHKEELVAKKKAYRETHKKEIAAKRKVYREKKQVEKNELSIFLQSIDWENDGNGLEDSSFLRASPGLDNFPWEELEGYLKDLDHIDKKRN